MAPADVLAGIRTVRLARPVVHDSVAGNPESPGAELNRQVLVRLTTTVSRTFPPPADSDVVLARKDTIAGPPLRGCCIRAWAAPLASTRLTARAAAPAMRCHREMTTDQILTLGSVARRRPCAATIYI